MTQRELSGSALSKRELWELIDRWEAETDLFSSLHQKQRHPAYQALLTHGDVAVQVILEYIADRGPSWAVMALPTLTGADLAIPEEDRGKLVKICDAWLAWGEIRRGLR